MNNKSTNLTTKENQKEYDILEEQFLDSSCKIDDIPLPKEETKDFQFEIRKIMESGCNRQIAEYSLIKCDIKTHLGELKKKYREVKNKIRTNLDVDVKDFIDNLKGAKENKNNNNENNNPGVFEDKNCKEYEEEVDEIMEEKFDLIENDEKLLTEKDSIKKYIMSRYKYYSDDALKEENFLKHKKAYMDKRDAILEAALRIVKKVVNNEIDYDFFYKEYKNYKDMKE